MLKRIAACILLLSLMQVPAVLGVGTEGIKNGGFDSQDGWSTSEVAIIESGALRLTGTANTASSQTVKKILGGNTYTFTAKYKTTGAAAAAITISYRVLYGWNHNDIAFTGGEYYKSFKSKKTDAFDVFTDTITVPPQTTEISVQLRRVNGSTGDVCWDDVSFTGTFGETPLEENPFKVNAEGTAELSLDEVFYYTEKTTATATVKTGLSADKVTYTLYEGSTKKWDKTENYGTPFSFPLSALKEETQYKLSARVKKGTSVIAEGEQIFYRVKRPTALSSDGLYYPVTIDKATGNAVKASEPMHPIFAYDIFESNAFPTAVQGGINVVQGYPSVLEEARKAGVKVLVVLYSPNPQKTKTSMLPAGHPNNVARTRSIVQQYKNHEAVYGWIVMDEPYYNLVTREAGPEFDEETVNTWLLNSYRVIHEEDPHHPVFIMQDGIAQYKAAARGTDILGIDPYIPQGGDPYSHVYGAVRKAEEATEKPVYALLQAFKWYNLFPTPAQLRHMVYEARLAGAEGFGYYKYSKADGTNSLPDTTLWPGLLQIKEEKDIIFGMGRGEGRDHGLYGETKDGKKSVLLYMGKGSAEALTATYADHTHTELIDIEITPISETEKMAVYESAANKKRFIWTSGEGFLTPGV